MIQKQLELYEAPTTQLINLRIESNLLTGSPWDSNNNTESLIDDGGILGL